MVWKLLAEGLSVGYDGKTLLRNLSFAVGSGECVLLCGGNGMGKSTLLRTLAGLQKPLGGTVRNPGGGKAVLVPSRIPKVAGFTVKKFIGLTTFQETDWLGRIGKELVARIAGSMSMLDIQEFADRDISTLSDGEFQKVCIAAAVARNAEVGLLDELAAWVMNADILLLDEPTAFLDVEARETVLQTLSDIVRCENAPAIIFSSHDIHSAVRHCTRIFGLYKNTDRETSFMDSGPCVSEFDAVLERCFPNIPIRRQL